jgi:diamine N-acetyltransferase
MSDTFIIRAATPSDYAGTCALLAAVDELHRVNLPWMFRKPEAEPRSKEQYEQLLLGEASVMLVAEAGELLVGAATILLKIAPDFAVFKRQSWGVLDNLAVLESWRRRGVGKSLTREAERWARSRGASWLELGVYEFNDGARAFYEALGYAPVLTKLRKPFDEPR